MQYWDSRNNNFYKILYCAECINFFCKRKIYGPILEDEIYKRRKKKTYKNWRKVDNTLRKRGVNIYEHIYKREEKDRLTKQKFSYFEKTIK